MRRTLLLLAMALPTLVAATLTDQDRAFGVKQLENSRKLFLESIKGLTEEQWKFKPAPDRWSIAECAEHITLSEEVLMQFVTEKLLKNAVVPRMGAIDRQDDLDVIRSAKDRSTKATAPGTLRPTGKWPTRTLLTDEFRKRRERTIEYIRTTQNDLRAHVEESGPGRIRDGFQYIMLISAHSERHTAQIEEIKQSPRFPPSSHKKSR
jgi:hypothetical protein